MLNGPAPLVVIAGRTSGYQVLPGMPASQAAGDYMIDCQVDGVQAAVLAGVFITPENLALGESDGGAWPADHFL